MRRPSFILQLFSFALLSCASAQAQDLQQTVQIDLDPMPVSQALAAIEQKTGVHLKSNKGTESQIVTIHAKAVKAVDLMNRLATATGAEWSQEADAYRLVRGLTLSEEQIQQELRDRAALLAKSLADMRAQDAKVPTLDRTAAQNLVNQSRQGIQGVLSGTGGGGSFQFVSAAGGGPGNRAITAILSLFQIGQIAAIQAGTRVVYSTAPTRMQRAFPAGVDRIIAKFVEEQRVLNQAMGESSNADARMLLGGGPQPADMRPVKSILVVSRGIGSRSLTVELLTANAAGETIGSGFSALSPASEVAKATFKATDPNTVVELGELSRQFAKLVSSNQGSSGAMQIMASGGNQMIFSTGLDLKETPAEPASKDWRERILNPEKYEPMAWVPNDLCTAIAKSEKKNLVACLPDACLLPMCKGFLSGKLNLGPAIQMAQEEWSVSIREEEGWIVIQPALPVTARNEQINRSGLGKMLRTLDAKNRLNLDEMAGYALSQPLQLPTFGFDTAYARIVNKPFADAELGRALSGEREMLRFYGLLGSTQRQALSTGRPIPLNGLTSDQLALCKSMVFDSMNGPVSTARNNGAQPPPQRAQAMRMMGAVAFGFGSISQERTEFLPGGLPVNAYVTLRTSREQAVFASRANVSGGQVMTANSLAINRALSSRTDLPAAFTNAQQFDRYLMGVQFNYDFTFQLGPSAQLARSLHDAIFDMQAQGTPFNDLPAGFLNNVQRAAEAMAARMNRIPTPAQSGGRTPPPSP